MTTRLDLASIAAPLQVDNPRLYQCIMTLNDRVQTIEEDIFPILRQAEEVEAASLPLPPPTTFEYAIRPRTVRLTWSEVATASQYEVRKATSGTDWDTASFQFRSSSLQADIEPLLIGTHTYLIKTVTSGGVYSETATSLIVTITSIAAVTIDKQVIDNNVLLRWNNPTTAANFEISYYEISRDGVVVGTVNSTFFTWFENVAGTYTYSVVAVDLAGNRSASSDIDVQVLTPPDYALQDQRTSALGGTRVNVILLDGPKLLANWVSETFQNHFTGRAWLDPQDQVDAGYPIYIQPANLTGSYEEVIDYGVTLNNVITTITFNSNLIVPSEAMTVVVKMATSTDGMSYSAFTSGASQFLATMRYLKFRLEFTGATDKALMEVFNVVISLNVKRENDGGEVSALASDVGGTTVTFNKAFKDIESITCTAKSTTEPYVVIFDFTDIPNPVSFKVYVFDTTGNRVSKTVEWKARGIV